MRPRQLFTSHKILPLFLESSLVGVTGNKEGRVTGCLVPFLHKKEAFPEQGEAVSPFGYKAASPFPCGNCISMYLYRAG